MRPVNDPLGKNTFVNKSAWAYLWPVDEMYSEDKERCY